LKEFNRSKDIDDASREFVDPITFSQILLNQSMIVVNKREDFHNCMKDIKKRSMDMLEKKKISYFNIKSVDEKWVIRGLLIGSTVLSLVYEREKDGVEYTGSVAYDTVIQEIYPQNPLVKYSLGSIDFDKIPKNLKTYIDKYVEEGAGKEAPDVWVNKYLYDIYVERVISDKGAYMHVLLGRDKFNRKYAVKIPREKTVDSKPLAVSSDSSALVEVLKGAINSLEVSLVTEEDLRRGLASLGYDEAYSVQLHYYRRYILRPKAIIISRNTYTMEEYLETPPFILEDYADQGDLDQRVRGRALDYREVLFLGLRLSGALALIHVSHFIHMDIKPQNILLINDDSEPYGYSPLISDFVGLPHVFDAYIDLKKSTPEYADPLALIRGKASYAYDVYGLGATLYYTLTSQKPRGRVLANLHALKNLYGVNVPLKSYLVDNPDLASYSRKLDTIYSDFREKKITVNELMNSVINVIEDIDIDMAEKMRSKGPEQLVSIIEKSLSLDETSRYRDGVALWIDLVKSIRELGFTNLIPSTTI